MKVLKRPNSNLLVPATAIDEKTGAIGDAMIEIGPESPDWEAWLEWLLKEEACQLTHGLS